MHRRRGVYSTEWLVQDLCEEEMIHFATYGIVFLLGIILGGIIVLLPEVLAEPKPRDLLRKEKDVRALEEGKC